LGLLMNLGFRDADTVDGLVGTEAGTKLRAFMSTNIDIHDLIRNPDKFENLSLDAKYMTSLMLSSWTVDNIRKKKEIEKSLSLVDAMIAESREFAILAWTTLGKKNLVEMIKILMDHRPEYKDMLTEVAVTTKNEIAVN